MNKNYRTIYYSELEYKELDFQPFHRVRGVCYNEGFWTEVLKESIKKVSANAGRTLVRNNRLLRRAVVALKRGWRKDFVVAAVLLIALLPAPHKVKAVTVETQIHSIARLEPVEELNIVTPEQVSPIVETVPVASVEAPVTGSCADWLAQAGIPVTYGVMELINGESGCNPHAQNPSGACGIGQNINGCDTYDPVAQLEWMNNYIMGRYGSWANAYGTWLSRSPHWY